MSTVIDCYKNIIGLSRNGCDCFDFSSDPTISHSGFYLDETPGLNLSVIDSLNDCTEGNLFERMNSAVENAIEIFKSDIASAIATRAKLQREPFRGYIGDRDFTRILTVNKLMASHRIYCRDIRSGVFRPKRIGLIFNQSSTFNISLYDNVNENDLYTWSVTTVAGKLTWFTIPENVELPMSNKFCKNYQYFFIYGIGFNMPKDNPIHCGCGRQPVWDLHQPSYERNSKYTWTEWVMATGSEGNVIDDRETWGTSIHANGLIIDAEFTCRIKDVLCSDNMDFEGDPLALKIALTIRYKAAELLLSDILSSTDLSRFSMIDREINAQNAGMYRSDYTDAIPELANEIIKPENINKYSDCFECVPGFGFRKGMIHITK